MQNFIDNLENCLDRIDLDNTDIFIMGDFNIDFLDNQNDIVKKFNNVINQWGCRKLVSNTTRYSRQKESCIDQIVTHSNIILSKGVADVNLSDHQLVYVQRKKGKMPTKKVNFQGRSYRNYNSIMFEDSLAEMDWEKFFGKNEPNELWDIMLENINNVADNNYVSDQEF